MTVSQNGANNQQQEVSKKQGLDKAAITFFVVYSTILISISGVIGGIVNHNYVADYEKEYYRALYDVCMEYTSGQVETCLDSVQPFVEGDYYNEGHSRGWVWPLRRKIKTQS